jgi:hypothetical protein
VASMAMRPRPRRAGRRGWENNFILLLTTLPHSGKYWGVGKKSYHLHLRLEADLAEKLREASLKSIPTASANAIGNAIIRAALEGDLQATERMLYWLHPKKP